MHKKSFTLHAEEQYGKKRFKHVFFETIHNNDFKHLVLKPFASSWSAAGVQDYVCSQIASNLNLESLASRACVLYLNGEYWGIYFLQEKSDERFLEDHFGFNLDNINVVGDWYGMNEYGSNAAFNQFMEWLAYADLSQSENYDYVKETIDIDCFIDYQIFELFAANEDWPANNMRCWQAYDMKWRWIFYDGDGCLRHFNMDVFANATYVGESTWPSSTQSTLLFRKLIENHQFVNQFKTRFDELINTTFQYSKTKPYLSLIVQQIKGEITSQSSRFNNPNDSITWDFSISEIDSFLYARPFGIKNRLEDFLVLHDIAENGNAEFGCFPNPSNGPVSIAIESDAYGWRDLSIFDITGRIVFHTITDETKIQLDLDLKPGLYFIRAGNKIGKMLRTL